LALLSTKDVCLPVRIPENKSENPYYKKRGKERLDVLEKEDLLLYQKRKSWHSFVRPCDPSLRGGGLCLLVENDKNVPGAPAFHIH
jgi:hypothetical protein